MPVAGALTVEQTQRHRVMSVREVADELRVSSRTVERLIREGRLRSFRLGTRRLIDRADLEAFLDQAKRECE